MGKSLLLTAVVLPAVLLMTGCAGSSFYDDCDNWVIRGSDIPEYSSDYDVFFLYPSQLRHTSGCTMNWRHDRIIDEIRHEVSALTTDSVQWHLRVFSPFVPQIGHDHYRELVDRKLLGSEEFEFADRGLESAVSHTVMALNYYLTHFNRERRPFVLIGCEQGATILYEALKRDKAINVKNGFAAAYFVGLPGVTREQIVRDFADRGIVPASGMYDYGVIAVCNPSASCGSDVSTPPAFAINPLNWRTDSTPAPASENPGSVFYDRDHDKFRRMSNFCGAVVDTARGEVMLTDIANKKDVILDGTAFESDLWGVFSTAIIHNAKERISEHHFREQLRSVK